MQKIERMTREIVNVLGAGPELALWTRNKEQCVDARCVIVTLLWEYGMTDGQIAEKYGLTRQGVNRLRNVRIYKMKKRRVREAYSAGKQILMNEE